MLIVVCVTEGALCEQEAGRGRQQTRPEEEHDRADLAHHGRKVVPRYWQRNPAKIFTY